jgi:hypothetical protein
MTPAQKLLALIVALPLANALIPLAQAAAPVDPASWALGTGTSNLSGQSASGITWGDNTPNNADNTALHATVDADLGTPGNQAVTLGADGDTVTFSGNLELKGSTSTTGTIQLRLGLYNSNGSSTVNGWLGYIVLNTTNIVGGGIAKRTLTNNNGYFSTLSGNAPTLTTSPSAGGPLTDGVYAFSLSLARSGSSITLSSSLIRQSDNVNFASVTNFSDTTPTTYTFDRIGFLSGGGLDSDQILLSNLSLAGNTVPEILVDTDGDSLDDNWEMTHFGNLDQTAEGDPDGDLATNAAEFAAGSNPANILSTPLDKDGDGLADAWEVTHFGNTAAQNGSGDPDGDLATNAAEFAAGSSPISSTSWPDADSDTLNDAWEVLYFGAIDAANATPLANPDADAFDNKVENDAFSDPTNPLSVPGDIDGDGLDDTWEITHFTNLTAQNGSGDPDADRATNEQEETAGSNPKDKNSWPDSDFDALNDAWEVFYFGNIAAQDGTGDPDGDTFSNDAEHFYNFSPIDPFSSPDLDTDSLADGWETFYFGNLDQTGTGNPDADAFTNEQEETARSNPTLAASIPGDTDGDGLNDAWETFYFGNTTAATASTADNDSDGATNAQEFAAGSNPNLLASTPTDTDGNGAPDSAYPIKPYTVDADTLHLWHLDETSAPFANAVNTAHNLQGLLNSATAWNAALPGFGTGVNTNSGTTPNFGMVTYAPALDSAVTGDTATPASPAFTWQGADGSFTLEALVKFDSLPTTWNSPTMGEIICMEGDGSLTQDRVFQFRIDTSNAATPKLQFQRLNTATQSVAADVPLTGDHAVDTTSWFHVAVTYDGNAGTAGNMKLYWTKVVPGTAAANLLGSGSLTNDFPAGIHGDLSLGNEARSSGGSTEPFRGTIDEVRISSIARADSGFLFAATAPAAPTELVATAGVNSVALSWTASPGATTYSIKRSTVSGGTPSGTYDTLSAGVVTGTTYTDTTALNGTTYYYVISAVATGESPNSTEVSATPRSAFQTWALGQGLTLGVNDGATQDPENDGLANLLEYATGITNNPLAATANPVTITSIVNGSSNRVLRLDFPRVNDPALTYVVRATNDLATAFADVASYPAASTPVQHEDSVTLAPGVRRFLRLEIRQN